MKPQDQAPDKLERLARSIGELSVEHIICCFIAREEGAAAFRPCVMSGAANKRELAKEWKARADADPELAARLAQLWAEQYRKSGDPGEALDCSHYPEHPETQILEGPRVLRVLKAQLSTVLDGQPVERRIAPPPLPRQALTAAKAAVGWAKSGLALTPPEELESRKAICAGCEFWDSEAFGGTGRCQKCGCSTWAKLQMASESCPIGKWKAV